MDIVGKNGYAGNMDICVGKNGCMCVGNLDICVGKNGYMLVIWMCW